MSTVMIVDDQAIIREPIEAALRKAGYQTMAAVNGAEALAQITRSHPDLILLDFAMPVMDGLTLLKQIRALPEHKNTAVIALTASSEKERVIQAAKLGVKGYMLKSRFSLSELLQQVNKCVGAAQASPPESAPSASSSGTASTSAMTSTPPATLPLGNATQPVAGPTNNTAPKPQADPNAGKSESGGQLDALRSLKPIISRSEMAKAIEECGELKGFSPVVGEVLKLTGNSRCSIEQIAKAISRDHAISLKMLKLANSAVYTRGEPVDSVQKAVLRIGVGQIRQAVLNIAVVERFNTGGISGFVDPNQFWEHAIATGIIAAEIAHVRSEKEADSAFTMGLLHDVGRMVYIDRLGDLYKQVLAAARELQLPLEQVEHRMLCYTHADVMDRVFRAWRFSKEFINPIVFHHISAGNMREAAPQETMQMATLALANRLAHAFMLGTSGNETIYATEEICALLKLAPTTIARIELMAREETDKVKFALLANSNQSNWPQLRQVHRSEITKPLRVAYASSSPEFDAHRIFCDQLKSEDENDPVNLGVLHIRHPRERTAVTEKFKAQEAQLGVSNLPLLILSSGGKLLPDNSILNNRKVEALGTPFTIARFVAAVNRLLA